MDERSNIIRVPLFLRYSIFSLVLIVLNLLILAPIKMTSDKLALLKLALDKLVLIKLALDKLALDKFSPLKNRL